MATYSEYLDKIRNIELAFLKKIPKGLSCCKHYVLLLLNKLSEARDAYLLLMDNERYTDAILIAGHIVENCVTINHIIQDLEKDKERTIKYVAKNLVQTIYSFLGVLEDKDQNVEINAAIENFVSKLKNCGAYVLKSKAKTNEQIIKEFKEETSNIKKKQILKDNYYFPIVEDYLRPFRKDVADYYGSVETSNQIVMFYNAYCSIKHNGAIVCNAVEGDEQYCVDNTLYREFGPNVVYVCLDYLKHKTLSILNSQD